MIGCIAHPVFLRVDIRPNENLRDLLSRVTVELRSCLARDPSRVVVSSEEPTDVAFNWLPSDWSPSGSLLPKSGPTTEHAGPVRMRRFHVDKPVFARFAPTFTDTPSGVVAVVWYDPDLFRQSTVERYANQLRRAAEGFLEAPNAAIRSLRLDA